MSLLNCLCCPKHKFRTATISDDLNVSYAETYWNMLNRACRLACYLRHTLVHLSGPGGNNVVALWTESCPEAVSAMLGVLSTPATYLPVSATQAPPTTSWLEGVEERLRRMKIGVVLIHHSCVQHFISEDWSRAHVAMDTSLLELGFICAALTWHHTNPSLSSHTPHPSPLTSTNHCTPTRICQECQNTLIPHLSVPTTRLKLPLDSLVKYQRDNSTHCLVCMLHANSSHASCLATISWDLPSLPPSFLAYMLCTSGTTGRPKLVWVPHCCIMPNVVDLRTRFSIHPDDYVFNAAPLTFDPSVVEIFLALSSGAAVLLVADSVRRSPSDLAKVLFHRVPITVLQTTPSLFHRFQEREISTRILGEQSHVRVLAFGGERCPSLKELARYKDRVNSTCIFNLYGTTEVSCWGSCHRVSEEELESARDSNGDSFSQKAVKKVEEEEEEEEEGENKEGVDEEGEAVMVERDSVPLGKALLGTQLEVRAALSCLPVCHGAGELWLGGGYRVCLLDNEVGSAPSCMRPTGDRGWVSRDGQVYFIGRLDRQIKRQGHRLSLDFIEEYIQSLEAVSTCAVVEFPPTTQTRLLPLAGLRHTQRDVSSATDSLLVAFAVPRHWPTQPTGVSGAEWGEKLLSLLVGSLPGYCIPDMVVSVRFIPVNQHGKVDTNSLKYFDNATLPLPTADPPMPPTQPLTASTVETRLQSLVSQLTNLPSWPAGLTLLELGATSFEVVRVAIAMEMGYSGWGQLSGLTEVLLSRSLSEVVDYVAEKLRDGQSRWVEPRKRKEGVCLPVPPRKRGRVSPTVATLAWRRGQLFRDGELSPSIPIPTVARDRAEPATCTLAVKWTFNTGRCVDASPLVVEQRSAPPTVYIGSHSGLFVCLGVESGVPLWQTQLSDRVESSACLSRCGGYVTVGCYDGSAYALEASTGHVHWCAQLSSEPIKSSPCVDPSTGIVWVGSHDHCLYGIDIVGKTIVHEVHLGGGSCFSSPCADTHRGLVYAATLQGRVVAVHQSTGTICWSFLCPKPVFSCPSILPSGEVVLGCVDGYVYVINQEGKEVDRLCTGQAIFSSCSAATSEITGASCRKRMRPLTEAAGWGVSVSEGREREMVEGGERVEREEGVTEEVEVVKGGRVEEGGEEGKGEVRLFCGSHDSCVYCWDGRQRRLLWKTALDSEIYSTPIACSLHGEQTIPPGDLSDSFKKGSPITDRCDPSLLTCVCVCSSRGILYLLDVVTGSVCASLKLPQDVFSSPVSIDNHIIVGCRDDCVYCVECSLRY